MVLPTPTGSATTKSFLQREQEKHTGRADYVVEVEQPSDSSEEQKKPKESQEVNIFEEKEKETSTDAWKDEIFQCS